MDVGNTWMTKGEMLINELAQIYSGKGYHRIHLDKLEDYHLFFEHSDFISNTRIMPISDIDGSLKALRPDVTLSIINRCDDKLKRQENLFYIEDVYREDRHTNGSSVIKQLGVEILDKKNKVDVKDILNLAAESLHKIDTKATLVISDMDITVGILQGIEDDNLREQVANELSKKASDNILALTGNELIAGLPKNVGSANEVYKKLDEQGLEGELISKLNRLRQLAEQIKNENPGLDVIIDLSMINDIGYYSGIIFKGYVHNVREEVLSGGRYDNTLEKFGKSMSGVGFAIYIDCIEEKQMKTAEDLVIAMPKGRLADKVIKLFDEAGYKLDNDDNSRKLIKECNGIKYLFVKPSDVHIYVERGIADIGIIGKDILLENDPSVYELADLGIGKCILAVAAKKNEDLNGLQEYRVASTFVNYTKKYFANKNIRTEVIKLSGSVEVAPLLGLSDMIVDLVETGNTLRANGLEIREKIADISARFISNKNSYVFKREKIEKMIESIKGIVR